MANRILNNSTKFFANQSMPGGVLTAPGHISDDTAARLKAAFEANFGGENAGKLAVLGDNLKFEPMRMTAEAAQLAEQLKFSIEDISRAFHYPLFKLGGELPAYAGNVEALIMTYYTDCLQTLIESVELCEDEGLALPSGIHTELDLEGLMRMDTQGLYKTISEAVSGGGWLSPNEGRFKANLKPVKGGDSPMIQQQNYSLEALAKRDAKEDPFATSKPDQAAPVKEKPKTEDEMKALIAYELRKELAA
jgi:HK97 family phage portal protein